MKTKRLAYLLLVIVMVVLAVTLTACNKDIKRDPGEETGTYYCDYATSNKEFILSLNSGSRFVLYADVELAGQFTVDGENLTLVSDNSTTLSAKYKNNVVSLEYKDSNLTFRRRVEYTVKFDTAGGSAVNAVKVLNGRKLTAPASPQKDGQRFAGWYKDAQYGEPFAFATDVITKNITLYARWVPSTGDDSDFTVTLDYNDEVNDDVDLNTTAGKLLVDPGTPVREGYTFMGWWLSDFNDPNKLTARYSADMTFTQNATLFALWYPEELGENEYPAPLAEVTSSQISWNAYERGATFYVRVSDAEGNAVNIPNTGENITDRQIFVDFNSLPAGEYKIEVTYLPSAQGGQPSTAIRYYNNKALSRVSHFEIIDNNFVFVPVENATKYYITVNCGDENHQHTLVDIGNYNVYSFANCQMRAGGIGFIVTATADGYGSSTSQEFLYDKTLEKVVAVDDPSLLYDEQTGLFTWGAVNFATGYLVSIECSTHGSHGVISVTENSVSLKECSEMITIEVAPTASGYITPEFTTFEGLYKISLPAPSDIRIVGNEVSWKAVANAQGYKININGQISDVPSATPVDGRVKYTLSAEGFDSDKDYSISLMAVGFDDESNSLWTDAIEARYNKLYDSVSYYGNTLTWGYVIGAEYYEIYVNGSVQKLVSDGKYAGVCSAKVALTRAGYNEIYVKCHLTNGTDLESDKINVLAHTITYNGNGAASPNPQYIALGDTVSLPEATLEGYEFNGWYNTPSGAKGNSKKFTDTIYNSTTDLVLYAYWTGKAYNVTFDYSNGGKSGPESASVNYGETYSFAPAVPGDETTAFAGWYSEDLNFRYTDQNGDSLTVWNEFGNVKLVARFVKIFEVISLTDGGIRLLSSDGIDYVTDVTVPKQVFTPDGVPHTVSAIEGGAFYSCTNLKNLRIPNTVTTIEKSAFNGCTALESITIYDAGNPDPNFQSSSGVLLRKDTSTAGVNHWQVDYYPVNRAGSFEVKCEDASTGQVTTIPRLSFANSAVTEIIIPETVTSIGERAFENCVNLESLIFRGTDKAVGSAVNGVSIGSLTINALAFHNCSAIKSVTLPRRMSDVSFNANDSSFLGCSSLDRIDIDSGNTKFHSQEGIIVNSDRSGVLYCPDGKTGSFKLPAGYTFIEPNAFTNCVKLTELDLSDLKGYTSLAVGEFSGCKGLTSLKLPSDITTISERAFQSCQSLVTLDLSALTGLTAIPNNAFEFCYSLESISLPDSVTRIGRYAFKHCTSLQSIDLSKLDVASLETEAFANCYNMETIQLPSSLVTIDSRVFLNCRKLDNLTVPKSVTTLSFASFQGCTSLSELDISSVTSLATDATDSVFAGCTSLKKITLGSGITSLPYGAFEGCTSLTTIENFDKITSLGSRALYGCSSFASEVTNVHSLSSHSLAGTAITSVSLSGKSFETSATGVFRNCEQLTTVTWNGSGTVPEYMFEGCKNLETFDVNGNKITEVRQGAFSGCAKLSNDSVKKFSNNITKIYREAFKGCAAITDIELTGVNNLNNYLFEGCTSLKTVKLSNGITRIDRGCFKDCENLESITLNGGSGITTLQEYAFYNCAKLTSVNFLHGITTIPQYAFYGCESLQSVDLYGVTSVANYAFANSGIDDKFIKSISGSIGEGAFMNCDNIHYLNDLKTITSIGDNAFEGCDHLYTLTLPATSITIGASAFKDCSGLTSVSVPANVTLRGNVFGGTTSATLTFSTTGYEVVDNVLYKVNNDRSRELLAVVEDFEGEFTVPDDVTRIADGAFSDTSITAIRLNSKVTAIPSGAFSGCTKLETIVIPLNVKSIGANAFAGCSSLRRIDIPEGVTTINGRLFDGCTKLTEITLPSTVTTINSYAFSGCSALRNLRLPRKVDNIQPYAFQDCKGLERLILPYGLTKLENGTFMGCTSLRELDIPETITSFDSEVFSGCTGFKEFWIPTSVVSMQKQVFYGWGEDQTIYVRGVKSRSERSGWLYGGDTSDISFNYGCNAIFVWDAE